MFTTRVGTPIEPRSLVADFKRILKQAKLGEVRFHDLRRSAASVLLTTGSCSAHSN